MPKHILIVDNDAGVRTVLGDMLEDAGYLVSLVTDGAEMRVFLANDKLVDAIVLDLLMPGENSADLARHAKSLKLPVIVTTGSNEKIPFAEEHQLPMLRKPFGYSEFIEAIEKTLTSGGAGQPDT